MYAIYYAAYTARVQVEQGRWIDERVRACRAMSVNYGLKADAIEDMKSLDARTSRVLEIRRVS